MAYVFNGADVLVGTSDTLLFTVPTGQQGSITIAYGNDAAAARVITTKRKRSITGVLASRGKLTLPSNSTAPYPTKINVRAGDEIWASADVGDVRASIEFISLDESAQPNIVFGVPSTYASGTTYGLRDTAFFVSATPALSGLYASRVAGNIGNTPDVSPTQWQQITAPGPSALAGGTMTGLLKLLALTEVAGTVSTGALSVSTGTVFKPAWSTNTTVSLANLPASPSTGDTVTATILATITNTPVLTWPSGTRWIGGTAPTIAAGRLVVTLVASWTGSAWEYYASGGMAS